MPFQPVFLVTDLLLYLLVVAVAVTLCRKMLRARLRVIKKKPAAMAALIVLSLYLLVGLSDSVHFRLRDPSFSYAPEVLSVLDLLPIRTHVEKTYSAPLAITTYTKETVEDDQGRKTRVFPRLQYGGMAIDAAEDHVPDIVRTLYAGMARGLLITLGLAVFGIGIISRRYRESWARTASKIARGEYPTAWRTVFFTAGMIVMVLFSLGPLSTRYHLFGTDKVGQDVLFLSLKAVRTGLMLGALTTLIMLPFAVFLGIAAGYFKGKTDALIQYLYTTLSAVPGVLLIAAAVLILQVYMDARADAFSSMAVRADTRLFFLCLILGTTGWIGLCRLLRGETLKLSELEYVQAARALGVGQGTILVRHILPNVMPIILISAVLDFSGLVLAEAVLSYVGIGVDPAMISWGNMINSARLEMAREPMVWWSLVSAFVMMFGLVLSANIVSDAVRDALDPKLREGRPVVDAHFERMERFNRSPRPGRAAFRGGAGPEPPHPKRPPPRSE